MAHPRLVSDVVDLLSPAPLALLGGEHIVAGAARGGANFSDAANEDGIEGRARGGSGGDAGSDAGGCLFIRSNSEEIAVELRAQFEVEAAHLGAAFVSVGDVDVDVENGPPTEMTPRDAEWRRLGGRHAVGAGWLKQSPFRPAVSETEAACEASARPVHQCMLRFAYLQDNIE